MSEPGRCVFESWVERERGGARTLVHAGTGCRTGPVEISVGWDRERVAGSAASTRVSPQLKWAMPLRPQWSAGVVVTGVWQTGGAGGYQGSTILIPATWHPTDGLAIHLNAGRDFRQREPDTTRAGAALEWQPQPAWSLVAERYRERDANFWRLGARWSPAPAWSVDLSRAAGSGRGASAWWTLGLNLAFGQ